MSLDGEVTSPVSNMTLCVCVCVCDCEFGGLVGSLEKISDPQKRGWFSQVPLPF